MSDLITPEYLMSDGALAYVDSWFSSSYPNESH